MAQLRGVKRVLVTGATGSVGRHVLPVLVSRGWDVHAVSSRESPRTEAGVVWHRADLLDSQQADAVARTIRASHLLHLAWYMAPGRWDTAPENFQWVRTSLDLLRAFTETGGQRMVTAGSCLEYDWNYGYCSEDRTPCAPHTAYGVCKHATQMLTSAAAAANGVSAAWGRLFSVYGPHEHPKRLVPSVIRSLLAGEPAACSHGNQIRDYLFAQDAADALIALLESDITGPLNLASGQPIALRDIVRCLGALLDRPELIRLGAIPAAPSDKPLVVADTTRLTSTLGWRPKYDLKSGLERTITWWQEQLFREALAEGRA